MRGSGRDQAASCLLAARYWFPRPLARSVGKASMSAAVSSLPQAPASFKRRGLTGRYTLTISPPRPRIVDVQRRQRTSRRRPELTGP